MIVANNVTCRVNWMASFMTFGDWALVVWFQDDEGKLDNMFSLILINTNTDFYLNVKM